MLTRVIALLILNSVANDSIVSIKSIVIVDLPLAVSPAIPIEAGILILPDKYPAIFLMTNGL